MKNVVEFHMKKVFDSRTVRFGVWQLKTSFEQFEPKRLKNFKSWTLIAFFTDKDSFYQKD